MTVSNRLFLASSVGCQVLCTVSGKYISVTSLNEYSDFVTVSLYIALFQAKDKRKGCGMLQVTVLERSYVAT